MRTATPAVHRPGRVLGLLLAAAFGLLASVRTDGRDARADEDDHDGVVDTEAVYWTDCGAFLLRLLGSRLSVPSQWTSKPAPGAVSKARDRSVEEMVQLARTSWPEATALEIRADELHELPMPCILVMKPGSSGVGHYLSLWRATRTHALLADERGAAWVDNVHLAGAYQGVAIALSSPPLVARWIWYEAVGFVAGFLLVAASRIVTRRSAPATLAAALGVLSIGACGRPSDASALEVVGSAVQDLGVIPWYESPDRDLVFTLRNRSGTEVEVAEVTVTCGCTQGQVVPSRIPAGGEAELRVHLRMNQGSPTTSTITVRTKQPNAAVVLGVKCFKYPPFSSTTDRDLHEFVIPRGSADVVGAVRIALGRPQPSAPSLTRATVASATWLGGTSIKVGEAGITSSDDGQSATVQVDLVANADWSGTQDDGVLNVAICYEGRSRMVGVPVRIRREPMFRCSTAVVGDDPSVPDASMTLTLECGDEAQLRAIVLVGLPPSLQVTSDRIETDGARRVIEFARTPVAARPTASFKLVAPTEGPAQVIAVALRAK